MFFGPWSRCSFLTKTVPKNISGDSWFTRTKTSLFLQSNSSNPLMKKRHGRYGFPCFNQTVNRHFGRLFSDWWSILIHGNDCWTAASRFTKNPSKLNSNPCCLLGCQIIATWMSGSKPFSANSAPISFLRFSWRCKRTARGLRPLHLSNFNSVEADWIMEYWTLRFRTLPLTISGYGSACSTHRQGA